MTEIERAPTASSAAAMTQFEKMALETDLEEVLIETLTVAFTEWDKAVVKQEDGSEVVIQKPRTRKVYIETIATMDAFNYMLKSRKQVEVGDPETSMNFMAQSVLYVWRQTEPDMTLERLQKGLGFRKVTALFFRFFNSELRGLSAPTQAPPAAFPQATPDEIEQMDRAIQQAMP